MAPNKEFNFSIRSMGFIIIFDAVLPGNGCIAVEQRNEGPIKPDTSFKRGRVREMQGASEQKMKSSSQDTQKNVGETKATVAFNYTGVEQCVNEKQHMHHAYWHIWSRW